ncbi:MAG: hypothetical protein WC356_06955 [Candidatus Micrarchaeia archaeon]|jgi:hypothetical protein
MEIKNLSKLIFTIFLFSVFLIFGCTNQEQPKFVEGDETLEVTLLDPNNNPISNVEIDLWISQEPNGPPTAGYLITNTEGKVIFQVPEGEYLIGFNQNNFPKEFIDPGKNSVSVKKGENQKTIILNLN